MLLDSNPEKTKDKVSNDIQQFIERHSAQLLNYLDGKAPKPGKDPAPLDFVDTVLDEWSNLFSGCKLPKPCFKERTFWYTLYQYEEIVEIPAKDRHDPYIEMMIKTLENVTELLRTKSELPKGFFATRPGEEPDDF